MPSVHKCLLSSLNKCPRELQDLLAAGVTKTETICKFQVPDQVGFWRRLPRVALLAADVIRRLKYYTILGIRGSSRLIHNFSDSARIRPVSTEKPIVLPGQPKISN